MWAAPSMAVALSACGCCNASATDAAAASSCGWRSAVDTRSLALAAMSTATAAVLGTAIAAATAARRMWGTAVTETARQKQSVRKVAANIPEQGTASGCEAISLTLSASAAAPASLICEASLWAL